MQERHRNLEERNKRNVLAKMGKKRESDIWKVSRRFDEAKEKERCKDKRKS